MSIHRTKRKMKENKTFILFAVICLVILISSVYLVFNQPEKEVKELEKEITKREAKYEITETDIFSVPDFKSDEISVKGIMLGDSFDFVLEKIGYPDIQTEPLPGITNIEYSKRINLNETGLILQFENKILKKITIREPFNEYLIGKTKIIHSKDKIYNIFGVPDDLKLIPINEGSPIVFRNNIYKDKGLEIYIRKNKEIGFGLVD